ncbi:chalcone isomerase family protein [Litorivivens sp.]
MRSMLRVLTGLCGVLLAATIHAAPFGETVTVGEQTLSKVAQARYSLLWKRITDVALYVDPAQVKPDSILEADYAKYLTIEYGVPVSAERFEKMSRDLLVEHWPEEVLARHRAAIDTFCDWLEGVKPGDRYAVYWLPSQGLTLALNDRPLGSLSGDPQGAAIVLSLWLGQAAVSEAQRDSLLQAWRTASL